MLLWDGASLTVVGVTLSLPDHVTQYLPYPKYMSSLVQGVLAQSSTLQSQEPDLPRSRMVLSSSGPSFKRTSIIGIQINIATNFYCIHLLACKVTTDQTRRHTKYKYTGVNEMLGSKIAGSRA